MTFLESIAVVGGRVRHASYHQKRMCESVGWRQVVDLQAICDGCIRESYGAKSVEVPYSKLRLTYDAHGILVAQLIPYQQKEVHAISLKTIPDSFHYERKYLERSELDGFARGLPVGVVPLLVQGGAITDTTYTNVCFRESDSGEWVTPSTPLLAGTMRASLLGTGEVRACEVRASDLEKERYDQVALINAMIPLGSLVLPLPTALYKS